MAEGRARVSFPIDPEPEPPSEPQPPDGSSGIDLDVGLPIIAIGNGYQVIDAREYVGLAPYAPRPIGAIERFSIHHSAGTSPQTKDDELATLQSIAAFHTNVRGWPGYAYHFTVAPSGRPYYTGDVLTTRYVVGDGNKSNLAICLLGNFTNEPPTDLALQTARELAGELQFSLGEAVPVLPHRLTPGTDPTACPGATWESWWSSIVSSPVADDPARVDPVSEVEADYALTLAKADEYGVPQRTAVALVIAESRIRRYARRPLDAADDESYWPDVSGGLAQQTVAWSSELRAYGGSPWSYPGPDVTGKILDAYYEPSYALDTALPKLKHYLDTGEADLDALCRYNAPAIDPDKNPNRENYRRALGVADQLLAGASVADLLA